MAKKTYISRYMLILKKFKQKAFVSFEEMYAFLQKEEAYMKMRDEDISFDICKRTFQRDLKEIRQIFGINIEFNKREKAYQIENENAEQLNFQRVLESFEIFEVLKSSNEIRNMIHLDNRRPFGTEFLNDIVDAIQKHKCLQFEYQKFEETHSEVKTIEPYAIKEFRNRWYLIGKDMQQSKIKTYALDRCKEFIQLHQKFEYPSHFVLNEMFENSFGITATENEKPKEIVLSFSPIQAEYIRTLPLHHSQVLKSQTKNEVIFQLHLCITPEFKMELLSMGNQVKVIKPIALINEMKRILSQSLQQYE